MTFEFDPEKSISNKIKHGIDFIEGQKVWLDIELVVVQAKSTDEPRTLAIGKINNKNWSAIVTVRNNNTRLISIRRARVNEIEFYESN
jgi:uncharacterized DUF497 family protein